MAKNLLDDHFQKKDNGPLINKLQRYQKYALYTFFTGLFAIALTVIIMNSVSAIEFESKTRINKNWVLLGFGFGILCFLGGGIAWLVFLYRLRKFRI